MAKRSFSNPFWTPVTVADTTTMTANGAAFLQGGTASQYMRISEIEMNGLAAASSINSMVFARDSTVAVTAITLGTNGKDAALDVLTAALAAPPVPGFSATTMPQRAATLHLLQLPLNTFGSFVRWVAYPGEEITQYGTAVNFGETSLSCTNLTGTPGALSSHIIYEPS